MNNMNNKLKKIAIMTSGGDAPGMNAAIRAVAKSALSYGIEPILIYEGFKGLCNNQIQKTNVGELDKFISRGGTHIYSSRYPEFKELEVQKKGLKILKSHNIDGLVVIGGDGSYKGALALHKLGMNTIAIPGTIDNDIPFTDTTIGFFSAINTVVETIDIIRNTAQSHNRLMLIETMGRDCPDITIFAGMAT
jgi:6-phosphofructokinase 1